MVGSFARDLILAATTQDVQRLTGLDEAICRRAVYVVMDTVFAPATFTEATEALIAGLREQDRTIPIIVAFWNSVADLSGKPTQSLGETM